MGLRTTRWIAGLGLAAAAAGVLALVLQRHPGPREAESVGMTSSAGAPSPRFLGVVDEPSAARLCDPELWRGIDAIVTRAEPGTAWLAKTRWLSLSFRSRAAVAHWIARCTPSGTPVTLVSSQTEEILGHYNLEEGLAHTP